LEVQISCDATENDTTMGISNTNFMGYKAGCMAYEAINNTNIFFEIKNSIKDILYFSNKTKVYFIYRIETALQYLFAVVCCTLYQTKIST
jgi:hypothetical protein